MTHREAGLALARRCLPFAAMALVAALCLTNALRSSYLVRDSFWIDIVWADQFLVQLQNGTVYPRWLPESHDGLGAPVFYFYPPLAFYVTSAFGLLGLHSYYAVIAAFSLGQLMSGVTMHFWLRRIGGAALPGALFYMAAPYHLFDFFKRGALAEFWAFAWIPLIALGLHRAARERGWRMLALGYAALIITHLPAAVITSIFLIAPMALIEWRKRKETVSPIIVGLTVGLALSAVYLIPMLALQPFVSLDTMAMTFLFHPENWSIWGIAFWRSGVMPALPVLTVLYAVGAALLWRRGQGGWSIATIALLLVAVAAVPALWTLPVLDRVQFPWRAFMLVEFAFVTLLATTRVVAGRRALAVMPLLLAAWAVTAPSPGATWAEVQALVARHPDVTEYLPPEAPQRVEIRSYWALDLARRSGPDAIFGFPSWEVRCGEAVRPFRRDPSTGLLIVGPGCERSLVLTTPERIGWSMSLITALALLVFAIAHSPIVVGRRLATGLDDEASFGATRSR